MADAILHYARGGKRKRHIRRSFRPSKFASDRSIRRLIPAAREKHSKRVRAAALDDRRRRRQRQHHHRRRHRRRPYLGHRCLVRFAILVPVALRPANVNGGS